METIKEKYKRLRSFIKNGDIILFRGNSIVSKIIMDFDNHANWSHTEIVFISNERIYVQGSNLNGNHPELLSYRLNLHTDFMIIRSLKDQKEITNALIKTFEKIENNIKYDFYNGIKELINRKLNLRKYNKELKITKSDSKICSFFAAPYAILLDMVTEEFKLLEMPFPQDFIRYVNLKWCAILDDSLKENK